MVVEADKTSLATRRHSTRKRIQQRRLTMNQNITLAHPTLKTAIPCDYPSYTPMQKLKKKACTGDAEAQFELARCYDTGNGVKKDSAEAAKWYRMAAERGHADAQLNVGSWKVAEEELESINRRRMAEEMESKIASAEVFSWGDFFLVVIFIVLGIPAVILWFLWKAVDYLSFFIGPVLVCKAMYKHLSR